MAKIKNAPYGATAIQLWLKNILGEQDIYGYELKEVKPIPNTDDEVIIHMVRHECDHIIDIPLNAPWADEDLDEWSKEAFREIFKVVEHSDKEAFLDVRIDRYLKDLHMDKNGLARMLETLEPNTLFRCVPYEKANAIDAFRKNFANAKDKVE